MTAPQEALIALVKKRDAAQLTADNLGAAVRAEVRRIVEAGEARPADVARWLGVTPQYVNKILHKAG